MTLYVKELWRYPVKSLAGERLTGAEITEGGVAGDRQVVIHNGHASHKFFVPPENT